MLEVTVRILLVVVAFGSSSAVLVGPSPAKGTPTPVTRADAPGAAAVPAPLPVPEARFFELVNGPGHRGYRVGSAQAGTQAMIVVVDLVVPGSAAGGGDPADGALAVVPDPPPGLSPGQFHVDSFFDVFFTVETDPAPGASGPEVGAPPPGTGGSTTPADLSSADYGTVAGLLEDPTTADEVDWYEFTLETTEELELRPVPVELDVDTEIWLYDADGLAICGEDPSTPNCSAAGRVIVNSLALLETCGAADDSPVCGELLSTIGPEFLGEGDYYVRVSFFSENAAGDHALDIEIDPSPCLPPSSGAPLVTPAGRRENLAADLITRLWEGRPGCSELFDMIDAIYDYNVGCDQNPSPACSSQALGLPEDPALAELFELVGTDELLAYETDWYSFSLQPAALVEIPLYGSRSDCDDLDCEIWLFDVDELSPCDADPGDANCQAAGDVIEASGTLVAECLESGSGYGICDELVYLPPQLFLDFVPVPASGEGDRSDDYAEYLQIDLKLNEELFDRWQALVGATGGPTIDNYLRIDLSSQTTAPCLEDPEIPGCGAALRLQDLYESYVAGCDENPTPGCPLSALPADGVTPSFFGGRPASTSGAPRTVTVIPGGSPGHIELTETGPGTGVFTVTDSFGYTFPLGNAEMLRHIFEDLPDGAVLLDGEDRIRSTPKGDDMYLRRDGEGRTFLLDGRGMGPPDGSYRTIELTVDESRSDSTRTVLTGGGESVTIPAPGVDLLDLSADPDAIAVTADEIAAAGREGGPGLVATITSAGSSTGDGAFDLRILNLGKPAILEGDAVFEPLSEEEAAGALDAVAAILESANAITDEQAAAYCLEKDKTVPMEGQLFRLASAGKQEGFGFASTILDASRRLEAAGALNPDSDPTAYAHATRQWAIWTFEKGYDREGFADAFVEHTRENFENAGQQWSAEIEEAVRGLLDNRWSDIQQVLDASGLQQSRADEAVAALTGPPDVRALAALLLGGLIAALAVSRPDR